MEDKKMNGGSGMVCNCCGAGCGYGGGWGGYHHSFAFMVLRCLLALIILGIVFALGVKIGEVKGLYERDGWSGGGVYQMMGGYPQGFYQSVPMMRIGTTTVR